MTTLQIKRTSSSSVQHKPADERFWVSAFTLIAGDVSSDPAFKIFVAQKVPPGKPPFRTLVWIATLESNKALLPFVEDGVALGLRVNTFSFDSVNQQNDIVIYDRRFEGEALGADPGEDRSSVTHTTKFRDVSFFRLDHRSQNGVIGVSCRALEARASASGLRFEITLLLEHPLTYSDDAISWALRQHRIKALRNPDNVNFSQLRDFLNSGWIVSARKRVARTED